MRRWRGAEAQAAYERALELSPKSVRFVQEYSRFNSFLDRHEAAVDLAERAIELDPSNPYAYLYLLVAHAFAGKAEAARDVELALIELAPDWTYTYRYAGQVETIVFGEKSLMPADYDQLLDEDEFQNLIAFLSRLSLRPPGAAARERGARRRP